MGRSFGLVDHKLAEADFFLSKISECGSNFFGVRCYVSAFVASARSVTFALQSVLGGQPGFKTWYAEHQKKLKNDPLARFFHEFRTVNQHIGDNLVGGGSRGTNGSILYWFMPTHDLSKVPEEDVEAACRTYMGMVTSLVYECYVDFGPHIDAHQRYTPEYFRSLGKTIEDAEEELGFPRGWTDTGDAEALPYRWQLLRDSVTGCEVNHIFDKYLGKTAPCPEKPPEYQSGRESRGASPSNE